MTLSTPRVIWQCLVSLYFTLAPARFSLLVAVALPALFLSVPQGFDILCGLGEPGAEGPEWACIAWFFFGLVLFGLMNWYGPRFLFNCGFSIDPATSHLKRHLGETPHRLARFERLEAALRRHLPRLLGTVPIALIGLGFIHAHSVNAAADRTGRTIHGSLGIATLLLAALLYAGFAVRRAFLNRRTHRAKPGYKSVREIAQDRGALWGFIVFASSAVVLALAFTFRAVPVGLEIGSGAVLLFALASWSCYGGAAVYFGHRFELPTLTLLALLVFGCSFSNDNHAVRHLAATQPPRPLLSERLGAWHTRIVSLYPREPKHPLFIVATEGGGIRAAYWTALVLSTLEDDAPARGGVLGPPPRHQRSIRRQPGSRHLRYHFGRQ